jgi:enoyl-CoA hydratase
MKPLVGYELKDGIAFLTMDDGKANVMSYAMLHALDAALDRALADKAVVLLAGREGMFSGGFDLSVFKVGKPEDQLKMLEAGALLAERLLSFPLPVVVACTGHAVAMGVFLLLCADVRVGVDQGARFQANEVQIGMTLPYFATEVCRQRLTPAHFNLTGITAMPYTPQTALAAGFLDEIAPAAALMAQAHSAAVRLKSLNAEAFAATKLRLRHNTLKAMRTAITDDMAGWTARFGGAT